MDEISIEDFIKIDMRVAEIKNAENVEEADKLLKIILDLGDLGERTVFAGIKKFYDQEKMQNILLRYFTLSSARTFVLIFCLIIQKMRVTNI